MFKGVLLVITTLFLGCQLDNSYQQSLLVPATVIIVNHSGEKLDIKYLSSTPSAESAFVYEKIVLNSGGSSQFKLTESGFEDMKNRHYMLVGKCGNVSSWEVTGQALRQQTVDSAHELSITVYIDECTTK